jgi:hypothetical protein
VFGESALNEDLAEEDRARRADVVADGPLSVVQLMQADFNKLLGSSLDAVARKNLNLKIMAVRTPPPSLCLATRIADGRSARLLSFVWSGRQVRRHRAHDDALVGRSRQAGRCAAGGDLPGRRERRRGGLDGRHLLHHQERRRHRLDQAAWRPGHAHRGRLLRRDGVVACRAACRE